MPAQKRLRRIAALVGTGAVILSLAFNGGSALAQDDAVDPDVLSAAAIADSEGLEPVSVQDSQRRTVLSEEVCSPSAADGTQLCLSRGADNGSPELGAQARAIQPIPSWCAGNLNNGRTVTRTQECETFAINIFKRVTQNGVTSVVGTAVATVASYQYTSFSIPVVAHQLGVSVGAATGDLAGLVFRAVSECTGSCTHIAGVIPDTPVTISGWREAESFTEPIDTLVGSTYYLATQWKITVDLPGGAGAPTTIPSGWFDLRCDNAAGGSSPAPGCAVYYAPGAVTYSSSTHPSLTNHISQAVASGLPGGSVFDPIHRTNINSIITANRTAACGSAPTITGLQCDEYPFASTYEGASFGGTPRSFPGCSLPDPVATGPGFSRCMINASQNMSGGTILGNTYRQQRILEADPFYVRLVP